VSPALDRERHATVAADAARSIDEAEALAGPRGTAVEAPRFAYASVRLRRRAQSV